MAEVARLAQTPRADRATLDALADLIPGPHLAAFVEDLARAAAAKRNGSIALELELSFGRVADSWSSPRLRPSRGRQ